MSIDGATALRRNFEYLLGGLLLLFLVGPLMRPILPGFTSAVVPAAFGIALVAGTWTLASSTRWRMIGLIFGLSLIGCHWFGIYFEFVVLRVVAVVGFLIFCILAVGLTLREVLLGDTVDVNRLMGAVCVYLLLGVIWGLVYVLEALAYPRAFEGLVGTGVDELTSQLLYYSFVTLTTLGYGDIAPATDLARTLAYLEAVVGQLYVAILIAGLVGVHIGSRKRPHGADELK